MDYKHWTKAELDIAIEKRKQGLTYRQIAKCLNRTRDGVAERLKKLPTQIDFTNPHIWSKDEVELLKQEYKGKSPAIKCHKLFKERLGSNRSVYAIQHMAQKYGLQVVFVASFPRSHEKWTKEQDEFLINNRQKHSLQWLSEKLQHSTTAINFRSALLKLNGKAKDEWYSLSEVSEGLGISFVMMRNLIDSKKIRATRRNGEGHNNDWEVREEDIYTFLTHYPQFLQNRRPDMLFVINILTKGGIKYKV